MLADHDGVLQNNKKVSNPAEALNSHLAGYVEKISHGIGSFIGSAPVKDRNIITLVSSQRRNVIYSGNYILIYRIMPVLTRLFLS